MGKRVLPTVQALSEKKNASWTGGEVDRETPRNKDAKAQEHDQAVRGEEWMVQLTESASAAY